MEISFSGIWSSFYQAFAASKIFFVIKLISAFSIFILLIANILLLSKRIQTDVKIALYGAKVPSFKKQKYAKWWDSISAHTKEGTVSSGKIALIESDKMLNDLLEKIGYKGGNFDERISTIRPGQFVGIEDVVKAHTLHDQIIEDPAHEVEMSEIKEAIDAYEKVFRGLEVLD